jgi:predicted ester cyclase
MIQYLRSAVFATLAASLLLVPGGMPVAAQDETPEAECPVTTPEENAALATAYWEEVYWGDQGTIAEIVAPDEIHHWGIAGDTTGFDEFTEQWAVFFAAFPDLEFTVDAVMAEGDMAATLWTATGTQRGEWQGIAPTDREVTWQGVNLFRFECGRIAESWGEADHLGLRQQLGATDVPMMMAATPMAEASAMATPAATPCPDDTPEANLAIVRRWTEDIMSTPNLEALDEIVDPAIMHDGGAFPVAHGAAELEAALGRIIDAFAVSYIVEQTVASDDLVAVRWSGTGTHAGEFLGIAPTGNAVDFTGTNVYRLSCGRIVQSWSFTDVLSLLQQVQGQTDGVVAEATPA